MSSRPRSTVCPAPSSPRRRSACRHCRAGHRPELSACSAARTRRESGTPGATSNDSRCSTRSARPTYPTTVVTTDSARRVADRAAYELVLSPRDTSSRIGSVRIAIDGKTKIPLGVQVYARGSGSPAIDVAYTRISFDVPDNDNFTFTPPASAHVTSGSADHHGVSSVSDAATIGKGWTTIVKLSSSDLLKNGELGAVIGSLPEVSWTGGSGRLFESKLLTALISDDGRVYIGAVDKNVLIKAAEHNK